jgi:hypothetical protein
MADANVSQPLSYSRVPAAAQNWPKWPTNRECVAENVSLKKE